MLVISVPIAAFMFLASRIKFHQLVYFIGFLLLIHLSYNAETKKATKKCEKDHNDLSTKIEFDANCYKETKTDADSDDPDEHMCFIMRRYCAHQCTWSVYGKKCDVESVFTLNLEEEDDGTPLTLDCVCSYNKYKKGCLSTYQILWEEVLEEFAANCSASASSEIKILLIGGSDTDGSSSMEYYYPDNPERNHLVKSKMQQSRMAHMSFLTEPQTIMTVGGMKNEIYLSSCETFDTASNKVGKCNGQLQGILGHADYTIFEGKPHICGGTFDRDPTAFFSKCWRYGTQWSLDAELPEKCRAFPMAEIEGYLYAVGGLCNTDGIVSSSKALVRMNMKEKRWETKAPMKHKRYGSSAAVLKGLLYVCGGYEGNDDASKKRLSSCEAYNPGTNSWKYVTQMNKERSYLSLVAAGDRLFAFGGYLFPQSVEMFDLKTKKWTDVIQPRRFHSYSYSMKIKTEQNDIELELFYTLISVLTVQ